MKRRPVGAFAVLFLFVIFFQMSQISIAADPAGDPPASSGEDPGSLYALSAVLMDGDQEAERFEDRYPATGFQYEILEAQRCLENGETESPCYTAEETWRIAELIEKTRKEWGIIYQADTAC